MPNIPNGMNIYERHKEEKKCKAEQNLESNFPHKKILSTKFIHNSNENSHIIIKDSYYKLLI
jgi:hypothetical protein